MGNKYLGHMASEGPQWRIKTKINPTEYLHDLEDAHIFMPQLRATPMVSIKMIFSQIGFCATFRKIWTNAATIHISCINISSRNISQISIIHKLSRKKEKQPSMIL